MTAAANSPRRRQALLILSMHRSGSSALAGTLVRLGAVGPRTPLASDPYNERGHYESDVMFRVHDRLLAKVGSSWDVWGPFDADALRSWPEGRAELRQTFLNEFGDSSPLLVFKDPRLARIIGCWEPILDELEIEKKILISLRPPIEVARSLRHRNGFSIEKGLALWLRHTLDAERQTRHLQRAVLTFDELLQDSQKVMRRVATDLDVEWPISLEAAASEIDAFLSKDLRHHAVSSAERSTTHVWADATYQAMELLAGCQESPEALTTLDRVAFQFEAACGLFDPLIAVTRSEGQVLHAQGIEEKNSLSKSLVDRDREIAAANGMLTEAQASHADLKSTLVRQQAQVDELDRKLVEAQASAERLNIELVGATSDRDKLQKQTDILKGQLAQTVAARDRLRRELGTEREDLRRQTKLLTRAERQMQSLLQSVWWRSTEPLRAVARFGSRLKRLLRHGRQPATFDSQWYRQRYFDIRLSTWDPYAHYLTHGAAERREMQPQSADQQANSVPASTPRS